MINWGIQGFDNFYDWKEIIFRILIRWAWIIDSVRAGGPKGMQVSNQVHVVTVSPGFENAR